jgi:hypothetical protein
MENTNFYALSQEKGEEIDFAFAPKGDGHLIPEITIR